MLFRPTESLVSVIWDLFFVILSMNFEVWGMSLCANSFFLNVVTFLSLSICLGTSRLFDRFFNLALVGVGLSATAYGPMNRG